MDGGHVDGIELDVLLALEVLVRALRPVLDVPGEPLVVAEVPVVDPRHVSRAEVVRSRAPPGALVVHQDLRAPGQGPQAVHQPDIAEVPPIHAERAEEGVVVTNEIGRPGPVFHAGLPLLQLPANRGSAGPVEPEPRRVASEQVVEGHRLLVPAVVADTPVVAGEPADRPTEQVRILLREEERAPARLKGDVLGRQGLQDRRERDPSPAQDGDIPVPVPVQVVGGLDDPGDPFGLVLGSLGRPAHDLGASAVGPRMISGLERRLRSILNSLTFL